MPTTKRSDPKLDALRQRRALNPRPERVTDELFRQSEFFDPRDLPQVKYEMLRRGKKGGGPLVRGAGALRFSLPPFFSSLAAYTVPGACRLLPPTPHTPPPPQHTPTR